MTLTICRYCLAHILLLPVRLRGGYVHITPVEAQPWKGGEADYDSWLNGDFTLLDDGGNQYSPTTVPSGKQVWLRHDCRQRHRRTKRQRRDAEHGQTDA